jgi:hypothetical protein
LDDEWGFSSESLSEKDTDVVNLISQEALTGFTFDGLKRRLGLHPETLSRILDRLEEEGIVEKTSGGYRVTPKIKRFPALRPVGTDELQTCLLQTMIPSNISLEQLVHDLRGRWFGLLRWLGCTEGEDGVTLKWITEDGDIQVSANILEPALTITAKFLKNKDLNTALRASYQLMTYISKLCSNSHLIKRVSFFGDFDFHFMPA